VHAEDKLDAVAPQDLAERGRLAGEDVPGGLHQGHLAALVLASRSRSGRPLAPGKTRAGTLVCGSGIAWGAEGEA
jgi:hypothetical protein